LIKAGYSCFRADEYVRFFKQDWFARYADHTVGSNAVGNIYSANEFILPYITLPLPLPRSLEMMIPVVRP